jgi:hypothetical protein
MSIGGAVTGGTPKSVLFIDSSGDLAQDNPHFTFDPVSNYLNVGVAGDTGIYYLNGSRALYQVIISGNSNWFEGNSGNSTLTGYGNFGTGDQVLSSLTTGYSNMAIGGIRAGGDWTGWRITTGYNNTAIGAGALSSLTTGYNNLAVGSSALSNSVTDAENVGIGAFALAGIGLSGGTGTSNLALGSNVFQRLPGGTGNIGIGAIAGNGINSASSRNILIGFQSGQGMTSCTYNTFVGDSTGFNLTGNNDRNTILGNFAGPSGSISDMIFICGGYDRNIPALDCGYTRNLSYAGWVWSFTVRDSLTGKAPAGINIYNSMDASPPTNYERAILDWNTTANVFRIGAQAGGTGVVRLVAIDGYQKAGAPAATDLPSGTMALINDTSGGATWLCYNAAGTVRKVQLT